MKLTLPDRQDAHVYGGLAILCVGAGLVWPPAALLVGGAVLLALGIWASLPRNERPES